VNHFVGRVCLGALRKQGVGAAGFVEAVCAVQKAHDAEVGRSRHFAQRANLLRHTLGRFAAVQVRRDVPVAHAASIGSDSVAECINGL